MPDELISQLRAKIDLRLAGLLPSETAMPQNLHRAIRYSALAPGKRLRGSITLLAAGIRPGAEEHALDFACAIEMVHAASLIIDDLPIMDDAIVRRGQPASHRVFGEDTATLAAFALLNQAYGTIAAAEGMAPSLRVELVALLHRAVGTAGLVGGQELDLHEDYSSSGIDAVCGMYDQKTGMLFTAAASGGARIAGLSGAALHSVTAFGHHLGIAYQLADDLADNPGVTTSEPSIIPLLGRRRSELLVAKLLDDATSSLAPLGAPAAPLANFALQLFRVEPAKPARPAQAATA